MCGIFGYIGPNDPLPLILEGLKRLEYRGYDSAGIAVVEGRNLQVRRASGKLRNLEQLLAVDPVTGRFGIGHTRWATHGRPTEENAHPHRDCHGKIVVVHNGIIENYLSLKRKLIEEGHRFTTETDTEVIAHLIEKYFEKDLESAVLQAIQQLRGSYAFAALSVDDPEKFIAARDGPPIVAGITDTEGLVASDVPALLPFTQNVLFLDDREVAVVERAKIRLMDFGGAIREADFKRILWDPIQAEKGGYRHFMLKEICEQPSALRDTILGRYSLDTNTTHFEDVAFTPGQWKSFKQVQILACGTSWHAALAGKYMIEGLARMRADVDYASEFRYREPVIAPDTLFVFITQSGETADTIAAQRQVRDLGAKILTVTNVVGSMTTRVADAVFYTRAGPEIGVASTKAFTSQIASLYLLAAHLGQLRGHLSDSRMSSILGDLTELPQKVEHVLDQTPAVEEIARLLAGSRDFLFLGRGIHFPIALEGALKLKEISYIHAEGYPAGEMKHGPNALIDGSLPVVFLAAHDPGSAQSRQLYEKVMNNMKEVKARDGIVVAVGPEGDADLVEGSDHYIPIPLTNEYLLPILEVIPLQLLAYHIAVRRGCDVDQPRNLAKSVTVE